MIRHIVLSGLIGLAVVLGLLAAGPGTIAQEGRLDLAAMALDQSDLPAGYRLLRFDDEGYTPGHRMAAIQFGDRVPAEELDELGIVQFYSSTFFTDDESSSIYVYLTEYESEAAVEGGFDFFENEANSPFPPVDSEDQPGPAAGVSPKEITIGTDSDGTPPVQFIDATFRIDRVLAGVSVGSNEDAPSVALVEELATALAGRINAVLSGEAPAGVNFTLSRTALDLFATWPWPGNSLEGYKSAEELLGNDGGLPQFTGDYLGGYARFASVGSVDKIVQHEPPYIDLLIAEFATNEAAMGVLEASGELPTLHYGNPLTRTPVADPAIAGVDAALAFSIHRDPLEGVADSFELSGYEVAFVVGASLVTITVLGDVLDTRISAADLEATVLDLAGQQVNCLMSDAVCGPAKVPEPLSETGMPSTPISVVP